MDEYVELIEVRTLRSSCTIRLVLHEVEGDELVGEALFSCGRIVYHSVLCFLPFLTTYVRAVIHRMRAPRKKR